MLKQNLFLYALIALSTPAFSQFQSGVTVPSKDKAVISDDADPAVKYAKTITAEDLKTHLTVIASPGFEGRETGQPGNVRAAAYIAKQFDAYLLDQAPGISEFRQPVDFTFSSWDDTDIYVNGLRFRHLWDYLAFPTKNGDLPLLESKEVLFAGFGIDSPNYTDYKGKDKDFKGKIIVINKGEPMKADSTYWISGTKETSEWSSIEKKLMTAKEKGVSLVLIIEDDIKKAIGENRNQLLGPSVQLGDHTKDVIAYPNHAYISTTIAKELFGKEDEKIIKERENIKNKGKFKPVKLSSHFQVNLKKKVNGIKSQNVIGVIPGKSKPDEVVIVSAHFDHLGKKGDQIFHGADDNGSGTSTVIELAQAFAEARAGGFRPERTVVFMLVTGEEKGLLGSEYYVNNPLYPLANTVADVNIDMVGRVDDKYKDDPNYIYVIGSDRLSTDLHKINESVNQKYCQLTLDYTYNSESDPNRYYYRSDHYNFAEKGIPAIFYFNGVHSDYHQPSDTADKINYEKMAKVGRLIFHTIWELANRPERIVVDVNTPK